jgi:hypothetical protein
MKRRSFTKLHLWSIALTRIAFIAGSREVIGIRRSPATVSLDVVNDGSEMVKQRRFISSPPGIIVGKRYRESTLPYKLLQVFHRRSEDHRTPAPLAQPAIALKHLDLKIF